MATSETWGPTLVGGRSKRHRWRRGLLIAGSLLGVLALIAAGVGYALWRVVDSNLTREELPSLTPATRGEPLNILVVGSDSRSGLTDEELVRYTLGLEEVGGQRSDTMILFSIAANGRGASFVSFPRDLKVDDGGTTRKLTETFSDGPDHVVSVLQANTGIAIHHYAEVSVLGFAGVVEALGGVEICLTEPLVDPYSGANFPTPGCQAMGPREALAYVRSRQGNRGDFERIDRQQTFLRAVLGKASSLGVLVDVPKLFRVTRQVASKITTDTRLGFGQMRALAGEIRGLAAGGIPMTAVPSYTQDIGGKSYVVPYGPGMRALYSALIAGQPLASRGAPLERAATTVAVWSAGRDGGAGVIANTLAYAGFQPSGAGGGPVEGGAATRVFTVPGQEAAAGWVAATLGVAPEPLPPDVTAPEGMAVVVAAGDDATT